MHNHTMVQPSVTVMVDNETENCEVPYDKDRIPLLVFYCAVLIVGIPANIITVYLTVLQVRRSNVLAVYLLSLSLCDFTYLLTLPAWAVYVSSGHSWPWSSQACQLTGYVFFTNMYISIFLLCCISLDRYVAVVYSLESRGLRKQRPAVLVSLAVWMVVGLGHAPVFTMREGDMSGEQRHCFEPGQSSITVTGFNYARFAIGFLGPLVLLIVTNRIILRNVHASSSLQTQQKKKVRLLAIAVVLLFLICFGPYHLILLIRAITFHFPKLLKVCHFELHVYTPYSISLGLSTLNSAVNPVLYVLSSDNIHKEIRSCIKGLRKPTIHQCCTESSQHTTNSSKNSSDVIPNKQDDTKSLTKNTNSKNKTAIL